LKAKNTFEGQQKLRTFEVLARNFTGALPLDFLCRQISGSAADESENQMTHRQQEQKMFTVSEVRSFAMMSTSQFGD